MQDPKLALIPAAQGSKFYSVLPSSGVGDFAFSRSGSATRINKDGLIETVGNGVSRLNYPMIDGVVSGCPHHILEPQRSNLLSYSNDFSQWSNGSSLISSNTFISPDGTLNASTLDKTSSYGAIGIGTSSASVGQVYTFSVFVKINTTNYISLRVGGGSNDVRKEINLITGVVTDGAGANQSGFIDSNVENFNKDFYRASITVTGDATTLTCNVYAGEVGNTTNDGLIDIYGAMLEQGSYPTSYIPTNGSTVTRSAETANGSGNSEVFNDSEGVLFANINSQTLSSGNDRVLSISDGTTNNRIFIGFRESAGGVIYSFVIVGGVAQANYNTNITSLNTYSKVTLKYKQNDFSIYVNGFKVYEDTSGSVFPSGTLSNLSFNQGISSNNFYGKTKELGYYDTALTDAELEYITSYRSLNELVTSLKLNTL